MIPYRNNKIMLVVLLLFFALIVGYAYFEARNILYGPKIFINTPDEGITVTEKFVTISGQAQNITEIWMNGFSIPVTEDGFFEESLLLAEGYNRILFQARDKLGRETSQAIQVVYNPNKIQPGDEHQLNINIDKSS